MQAKKPAKTQAQAAKASVQPQTRFNTRLESTEDVQEESPLQKTLFQQKHVIRSLSQSLTDLEARLAPLLQDSELDKATCFPKSAGGSPIVSDIHVNNEEIAAQTERVLELLSKLEV